MHENDRSTHVAELTSWVRQFVEERDWDQFHTPKDLAIGLSIEASELLEHFRFLSDDRVAELLGDEEARQGVAHELADVLYFVLLMCSNLGLDTTTILREKLNLSAERYPIEKARGRNVKYTELGSSPSQE
ncbi:MAG: nucleotide pyrophosphohydrolase [Candidatus Latescibacteria bacterium]|jgi:NTP pyrophosphatase (non-canonical NTP hydrolase)|nr:nucleotide pyrophosphohydrolase [Candidatus Latescibacterota bacterium]MEC8932415.1 nucleotide pyrophosphohydrolase [Candidatus Latescibacterota bacterium]